MARIPVRVGGGGGESFMASTVSAVGMIMGAWWHNCGKCKKKGKKGGRGAYGHAKITTDVTGRKEVERT